MLRRVCFVVSISSNFWRKAWAMAVSLYRRRTCGRRASLRTWPLACWPLCLPQPGRRQLLESPYRRKTVAIGRALLKLLRPHRAGLLSTRKADSLLPMLPVIGDGVLVLCCLGRLLRHWRGMNFPYGSNQSLTCDWRCKRGGGIAAMAEGRRRRLAAIDLHP